MVEFISEIINQIKEAVDDTQIKIIICNSMQRLQLKSIKGFGSKRRFMMNMIATLSYVKMEGANEREKKNIIR